MKSLEVVPSIIKTTVLALSISALAACGGGGGGSSTDSGADTTASSSSSSDLDSGSDTGAESGGSTDNLQRGQFLDSAVSGLWYETETLSGFTDVEGFFEFLPGETVRFFLGETLLGESDGKVEVTPLDLLTATDHPDKLQNILRVLQTIDFDSDAENGIHIPRSTDDYLSQFPLPINSPAAFFEASSVINDLVAAVTNGGSLKDAFDSFMHFRETLLSDRRNTTDEVILDLLNSTWDAQITSTECGADTAALVYNFNILGVATMGAHDLAVGDDGCSSARNGIFFNTYETDALFACANECTGEDLNRVAIEGDEVTTLSYDQDAEVMTIAVTTLIDGENNTKTTVLTAR
jgi:hypothetical protein